MTYNSKVYTEQGGSKMVVASAGEVEVQSSGILDAQSGSIVTGLVLNKRQRFTIAEINAGATLLSAVTGYKYRMIDCQAISVGGAAGAVTTVDILSTQTTSVKLAAFAQAQLTQSTVLRPGITGCAVLADGASFVANDSGAAVTVGKTGSDVTTATHIDIEFTYVMEAA